MTFNLKYLDGTLVEPEYLEQLSTLLSKACDIEEEIGIDELEDWAEQNS